jgi:DNA-binding NtrC family response regulator
MISVLVIDDDSTVRETLAEFLRTLGYSARSAATAIDGGSAAAANAPDVALVDLRLPDATDFSLLDSLRADDPELGIVMLTSHADVPTAMRALQHGAIDFLEKPLDLEAVEACVSRAAELVRLRREVVRLRERHSDAPHWSRALVPAALERLVDVAVRDDNVPVLIVGEAGTGKGHLARRIHEDSERGAHPLVVLNAERSATRLESELFGHERGAFADAQRPKRGLFEVAARGSVLVEDIGDISPEVQSTLQGILELGTFRREGGTAELQSEARVLATTKQPLSELVAAGRFRSDLYYRLQALTLTLPPLRERRAELPSLAFAFLPHGASLTSDAIREIEAYPWPGNVRELRNALWRGALLAGGSPIEGRHLSLSSREATPMSDLSISGAERLAIHRALEATGGNRLRAAELLGIARSTLQEKLKRVPSGGRISVT